MASLDAYTSFLQQQQSATRVDNSSSARKGDWRLRDAAEEIITQRQALLPSSAGSSSTAAAKTGGRGGKRPTQTDNLALMLADDFPIQASLDLLRLQKTEIVNASFSAAAATVLKAVVKKSHQGGRENDDDEETSSDKEDEDAPIPNLPQSLADRHTLAALRRDAFARSLDNKEWAKKRTPKAPAISSVLESSSVAGTTAAEAAGPKKGGRKRKADTAAQDSALQTTATSRTEASAEAAEAVGGDGTSAASAVGPKFTRNTPASSAAALDHRFTNSRAILCAAGNLVMAALTPDIEGHELEPNDVPQKKKNASVNLGAMLIDANVYAQRTISICENAVKRSELRNLYRRENARHDNNSSSANNENSLTIDQDKHFLKLPNLFGWKHDGESRSPWSEFVFEEEDTIPHRPNEGALTWAWESFCLPRLQEILESGSGHVLYHDVQWFSRHGRLANFLKTLQRPSSFSHDKQHPADREPSFGPHLIVTTQPDVVKFAQEFHDMRSHVRIVLDRNDEEDNQLRVLAYDGTSDDRRRFRKHFAHATGLAEAPFHVIVVSYTHFLEDYLHFCQMPFEVVILDEGASWMAASHGDPNSSLATVWEQGIWSRHQHAGVAGTVSMGEAWDFTADRITEAAMKEACIGLTARHRVMTASHLVAENRSTVELLPISGVVSFVAPHFAAVVQEEWDRSNIAKDADSMQHFRRLVARSMCVHHGSSTLYDMHEMALLGLEGQMNSERFGDPITPDFISDDDFVAAEKVTFSRRACLSWLGTKSVDWLRYELGTSDFRPILEAMKVSSKHGHFCEEITTASSTTAAGATGLVGGTMAYRCAVCCLRHFGSEAGLRQHISAQHAPPGTWLCRTCGVDCITSQARTHHERTCGQPASGPAGEPGSSVGATPTVGQKGGVGKKKSQRATSTQQGGVSPEEKDPDGSLRVPGYRGVWVNKEGKHFIKIDKKRYTGDGDGDDVVLFDSNDAAARQYDEVVSNKSGGKQQQALELNFKPDGSRNIYEDATSSTASGLGGSAANVVPLLSVINIKDLPPDVKPLLRDPRQTSRTGGNSKRHVYAYRGVCRQARKGHDRWQSQISFMGVNHYLGTFDSEWDAAAIYAWAHLILYGEEATKQAQKEGEEAAEAYEQEKRDIAAGKIPAEPPKAEKTKKQPRKKQEGSKGTKKGKGAKGQDPAGKDDNAGTKKRKAKPKDASAADKKAKVDPRNAKHEKEAMNATLSLGVSKVSVLGEREGMDSLQLQELEGMALVRLRAAQGISYSVGDLDTSSSPAAEPVRPSLSMLDSRGSSSLGAAVLVGLPHDLGWSLEDFVESNVDDQALGMSAVQVLAAEYDEGGANERFRSVLQGSICVIGRASDRTARLFREVVGTPATLGRGVGDIDCFIGGISGTCSDRAACIRYASGEFHLCCLCDGDVVTLNGQRISSAMDWVALDHNDVCTVGPRVFVFVLQK